MNTTFEEIAALKENWNGYGAKPISPAVILRAREFYEKSGINLDFMSPTARDTIQFECQVNVNYLEVEIYPRSFHLYLVVKNNNLSYEEHFKYIEVDYKKVRKIIEFFNVPVV